VNRKGGNPKKEEANEQSVGETRIKWDSQGPKALEPPEGVFKGSGRSPEVFISVSLETALEGVSQKNQKIKGRKIMKKSNPKQLFSVIAALVLTAGLFAASESAAAETVLVGTGAYPSPYTYQEDDGTIKGIDIDLLRAIFKGSGYNLEVEPTEFTSVLGGLDTERYQIGANAFSKTPARQEKYLFSKPIYTNPLGLIVPINSKIASFADLPGKVTTGEPAVSYTVIVERYNEENPGKPITLNYTEKDIVLQFQDVIDGTSDFKLESAIIANKILKDRGLDKDLKVITLSTDAAAERSAFSHYIFPKTEQGEKLRAFVNKRLEELRVDGTLDALYRQYFHGDYKPSDEEFNTK
jgi:polar amino acid transport system substrate-binding protein